MKRIYRLIVCLAASAIAVLSSEATASAQSKISGVVKDDKGEPVVGASVILEGSTSVGTMTDVDGTYNIVIPAGTKKPRLQASCLGYSEQTLDASGKTVLNFTISESSSMIEETVVVGYGSMRKSDLTGSVTSVRIDDDMAARSSSLDQLIQGRAAGVQVLNSGGAPDGGLSMRIRGTTSFSGSEPLYVVDGIIINAGSTNSESILTNGGNDNAGGNDATNGLMGINPQDIASIEILKDASATAIYGALGANGVVLITTKMANRERPSVYFTAGLDVSNLTKRMDVLSFDEYGKYLWDKVEKGVGVTPGVYLAQMYENTAERTGLKVTPKNWQDESLRTALGQRYYLSISGRPRTLSYALSVGFSDQKGVVKGSETKQYTIRLNLDNTIKKRVRFGTKTNLSYIDSDVIQGTGSGRMTVNTSLMRSMISYRPYLKEDSEMEEMDADDETRANPSRWMDKNHYFNFRKEFRITPSIFVDWKIVPFLSFRSTLGGDYRNSERQTFKSTYINSTTEGSVGAAALYEYFTWNWDNVLTFNKKFKGHSITATLGASARENFIGNSNVQGWNIEQFKGGIEALNAAPNSSTSYSESVAQTLSFFARALYNYKERYVLTATFRADGSSKFQGANKWAYFPSFAFAWRLSEEPWFKVDWISSAKLRAGWGRVGNQSVANYQTLHTYGNVRIAAHDPGNAAETSIGLYPSNFANPNLKWETTEQTNLGLDISLWKGRLALTADAYIKTTFDLLQSKSIPVSSGFSTVAVNEGTIENKGLEFTLDAVPVKTKDLEWTINGNISFNRNKIVTISNSAATKPIWTSLDRQENVVCFEGQTIGGSAYLIQAANIFMEGYPMGLFYGYKTKGIVQENGSGTPLSEGGEPGLPGQFDYYDLNGNGYIDVDDRTIIGDPNPDFTYGFGTTLSYKGFRLAMNFNGTYGNDILNANLPIQTDTYASYYNILRSAYYDAWTPENPDAKYPALGMIRSGDYNKVSDFYIEDGSFLRLSNITLGYTFRFKAKKPIVRSIGLSGSLNNVFIWTKYSGWDPDVSSFGGNVKKMGVDSNSYPNCRTFSFDLKFNF